MKRFLRLITKGVEAARAAVLIGVGTVTISAPLHSEEPALRPTTTAALLDQTPPSTATIDALPDSADEVNACDEQAGHPADPSRSANGIADGDVDINEALPVCNAVLAKFPDSARAQFQLGRVLWLAEQFDEALPFLTAAAEQDYSAAKAFVADAFAYGLGGATKDERTALALYEQSAAAGFLPAEEPAQALALKIEADLKKSASSPSLPATMTTCDRLAAHPADPKKVGVGVADAALKTDEAIPACEAALAEAPGRSRFMFQLGRSYYLAQRYADALPLLAQAAEQGSAAARFYLADAYLSGENGAEQDLGTAYAFATEAVTGGFQPAQAIVTELKRLTPGGEGALGRQAENKLILACEYISDTRDTYDNPVGYETYKTVFSADLSAMKYTFKGDIIGVNGVQLFKDGGSVSSDNETYISFEGSPLEGSGRTESAKVTFADGKFYFNHRYLYRMFFGMAVYNRLILEGYCGQPQTQAVAKTVVSKAKSTGAKRRK